MNNFNTPILNNSILDYLQKSGKIAILKEGIMWIYKDEISQKLRAKLRKGVIVM